MRGNLYYSLSPTPFLTVSVVWPMPPLEVGLQIDKTVASLEHPRVCRHGTETHPKSQPNSNSKVKVPFEDPATGVKRAGAQLGQSSDHDFVREHKPEACLKIQGWAHAELRAQRAGFMPARRLHISKLQLLSRPADIQGNFCSPCTCLHEFCQKR